MNYFELLNRATLSAEPVFTGTWGILLFRPDLGSQQEFVVGVAAAINGDASPRILWLPSLKRLSALYGESLSSAEAYDLFDGAERVMKARLNASGKFTDTGTPHIRFLSNGYFAADNIDQELARLLRRHAQAIFSDPFPREELTGDDWAYRLMRQTLAAARSLEHVFIPNRSITLAGKSFDIGLDNRKSYGNIVSARYAQFQTVQNHILQAHMQMIAAHRIEQRATLPALFVVLPEANPQNAQMIKRSEELLEKMELSGIEQHHSSSPFELAEKLAFWADV